MVVDALADEVNQACAHCHQTLDPHAEPLQDLRVKWSEESSNDAPYLIRVAPVADSLGVLTDLFLDSQTLLLSFITLEVQTLERKRLACVIEACQDADAVRKRRHPGKRILRLAEHERLKQLNVELEEAGVGGWRRGDIRLKRQEVERQIREQRYRFIVSEVRLHGGETLVELLCRDASHRSCEFDPLLCRQRRER